MLGSNNQLNVGIHAVEIYFPKKYVNQTELEQFDGVSAGKYTIGLGQSNMGVCDDREDICSISLTVVQNLLEKYNISPNAIGRLDVGTETIIDKSKSVKTVLMQLFEGNADVEGIDSKNACYGGTNALFSAINWLESTYWDGRYALVVAADIAVYKSGAARPTGGAGAVAMLLGRDAPIVFDQGLRATHMEHVWDFYKPDLHSEYPEVDGALSTVCYTKAIDKCYEGYIEKIARVSGTKADMSIGDYFLFHCPYNKLVQKSFGRIAFNDLLRNPTDARFVNLTKYAGLAREATYSDKEMEKAFVDLTKAEFAAKVSPGLLASKNVGNMYCGSLYAGLASLLSEVSSEQLMNKRIVLFSYGSGFSASMFSCLVRAPINNIAANLSVSKRLNSRTKIEPSAYDAIMALREGTHNARSYDPVSSIDSVNLFPGTFYLEKVDEKFRRTYARTSATTHLTQNTYKFKVGMTCGGCSGAVNRILSKTDGVSSFDISLETQTVVVNTASLSKDQVFEAIKKSGKPVEAL
ncbi:Hydroxymethylglutaryl-CoA synthase, cytoplasmic [Dinochytrium kinnereticum]|nr:Hydroxymethylglutaryl-CoA synthase, cytoplasmic [Dinochytrium kinnereticum]